MPSVKQETDTPSGVPALDELHRLCRHAVTSASNRSDADFENGLRGLLAQFERAFAAEERWMDSFDHPAVKCHREQHARVLGALHHVHAMVMEGDIATGRHAVDDLLPRWLSLHIETMDTVLAAFMRFDERRKSPSRLRQATEFV